MQYVRMGRTGLQVSRICLGMMSYGTSNWREWVLNEPDGHPIVKRAVELGINFFDTADMYSMGVSEEVTGRYLREFFGQREEYVLASKVFFPMGSRPNQGGLSRKHILAGVEASLRRLQTDYIDLYQIHRYDPNTPIEETLEALHDVVKAGKVRYIGASSMWAWQFAQMQHTAEKHGWTQFVTMQNHYNLIYREEEREMNPLCLATGVGLLPWSPLARGFLAGNRTRGGGGATARARSDTMAHDYYYNDNDFDIVDRLKEVAQRLGHAPAQVAIAWLLHQPAVTAPIIGATRLSQLEDAAAAVEIALTAADRVYLEALYTPRAISGHA
ncbi:MAG: aldo/keto reductase [Anaerolineae bacterium]|jgi:aryl-alcohol dehydrogenase-like predicted oxidoreductase|nr:aldo/keto reductase [Anaerolineae bacterium]